MSFAKFALEKGGSIHPLIIPSEINNGLGLMNPSILINKGKILVNLRAVNYTFYHSEKKLFQHQWGPLTYVHPENDMHLRTTNYYLELDEEFGISRINKIDTSEFDTYEPLWEFVGLEDGRLVFWDDKLYLTGVRRDTTTNGQGRMELSELQVTEDSVKEVSRYRIPTPFNIDSYCEKNWMPILNMPFHYIKWADPTEFVKVDQKNNICEELIKKQNHAIRNHTGNGGLRGGSQVISWKDNYIAVTHEVDLFNSEVGRKDVVYRHRFIVWDKDWNIVNYSKSFSFMDGHVEFCVGMVEYKGDFLITYGFQDNAAYLLRVPQKTIEDFINE
jgi:predicted GH43/DUF377 family glycosyl hydrolase